MATQVDPRLFDIGGAFMGGVQQSQDNRRRNALLDMQQQNYGQDKQRFEWEQQDRIAQQQQGQSGIERRTRILTDLLPDQFKPMAAEIATGLDDNDIAKMLQDRITPKNPGQLYKVGPQGTYATADQALGQPAYDAPNQTPPGTWTTTAVAGPDGQPIFVQTNSVTGQTRRATMDGTTLTPPPKPDPASETDKKVGVLFGAMVGAENAIAGMVGGIDTSSKSQAALGATPITALFQSDKFRQYESAALRWAANLLYIKSGATAPPEEVRSTYKQFFPQPGDGPETIAQKEAARAQEAENIKLQYPDVTARYNVAAPKTDGKWSIKRVK